MNERRSEQTKQSTAAKQSQAKAGKQGGRGGGRMAGQGRADKREGKDWEGTKERAGRNARIAGAVAV